MKPNVLLLTIDSLSYEALGNQSFRKTATPFLDSLQNKGMNLTNLYAQSPFTEAALTGLICGSNPLDNDTYLFGYKGAKETVFELFQKNGYETYNGTLYPSSNTTTLSRGIDTFYYAQEFYFHDFYSYRLLHFLNLYKNKAFTKREEKTFVLLLEEMFESWLQVLTDFKEEKHLPAFIKNSLQPYDYKTNLTLLKEEQSRFYKAPKEYIKTLFKLTNTHPLFEIAAPTYKKVDDNTKSNVKKAYTKVLEDFYEINKKQNKKNNKLSNYASRNSLQAAFHSNFLKNAREAYYNYPIFLQIEREYDRYKRSFLANKHFQTFLQWEKTRKKQNPFFASIHLSDIHAPPVCFSYDESNFTVIEKEFQGAIEYVKTLPESFKGNLNYYLALRTLDEKIKAFFKNLKKQGLLENTLVAITSDHGSSHLDYPIRPQRVNGPFREFYHVPGIIVGADMKPENITTLCYTKDFTTTIASLCGLSPTSWEDTKTLNGNAERDFLLLEFLGEGCGDIFNKEIEFICFDNAYKLHCRISLNDTLTPSHIVSLFDLKKDPLELSNLVVHKTNLKALVTEDKNVSFLMNKIKARLWNLKNEYCKSNISASELQSIK